MIHPPAAAATTGSTTTHGDWWTTAVSWSPDQQLPAGFGGWASSAAATAGGNRSRSGNNAAASSESPGSKSNHSLTTDQGVVSVPPHPPPAASAHAASGSWNEPSYYLDGSAGFMSSSRSDQAHHLGLSCSSSDHNSVMVQGAHDPNQQFLSNLGFELLSSPTSSSGGFRSSSPSLLRSLTEPSAAANTTPPGLLQQYQQQQQQTMDQAPAGSIREALQLTTNRTPFWNPCAEGAASLLGTARPPSSGLASFPSKGAIEGAGGSSNIIAKRTNTVPTPSLKKPRTGTPSPLPTFKVRKEKLGDRITALQQLVSPFGKTDTASVLHETIEYIKFLHAQVGSLSASYLKNRQQVSHHHKVPRDGGEAAAAEGGLLTRRGLCLVPISSTFAVAIDSPVDFWTLFGVGGPAFG